MGVCKNGVWFWLEQYALENLNSRGWATRQFLLWLSLYIPINTPSLTFSSVVPPAISGTTLAKSLKVSKSSTIFDALFVINKRKMDSTGWYTYRTLSVSMKVCCFRPVSCNLGKAASKPSTRSLFMSTNCRANKARPFLVVTAAERMTMV